jgi:hypothetical protein
MSENMIVNFMEISTVKAMLYLGMKMNFSLCFPHFLPDLSEVWCMRSAHNAGVNL